MGRKLSTSGIYRLALYNRYLSGLDRGEYEYISSQELADATGHTAAQVRKDLTSYGSLGEPGKGYEIRKLRAVLTRVFGKEKVRNVVLVGVGNLGLALIAYGGFQLQQFKIVAAFDRDVRKIGKYVEDVLIHDIRDLNSTIANTHADIAIVSVPARSAQRVVDQLVSAGIKAILNFAPANNVSVPEGIKLQNVDMSIELDRLYYLLQNSD
jgi:redox-sensing transcriptional repressor